MTALKEAREKFGYRFLERAIGNTPLIHLRSMEVAEGVEVFAKAEHLNPGGSVKDRAALSIILAGERSGALRRGKTILDATSGNTGISYAMIGAVRGYKVAVALPANANGIRKRILALYGAEIIETDPLQGTDGAQAAARELANKDPTKYFYADQYNNEANWKAHYLTTAEEIWAQSRSRVTHFVAGLGTSGTFVGTTRRLKEMNRSICAISVQPATPLHGLEGLKHLKSAIVPGIYDPTLADANSSIVTEAAQEMARRLAKDEGLLVGPSSGANVLAAVELGKTLCERAFIVTVLCDGGWKYLNEEFWDE